MKKGIGLMFLLFFLFSLAPALVQYLLADEGKRGTLKLFIDGFPSDGGSANIALCNSAENFENRGKELKRKSVLIKNKTAECTFPDLPFGEYAVKVHHDENGNDKLDRNVFGVPQEAYGFSNNVRGTFGPPDFSQAAFKFNTDNMTLQITVK